MAMIERYHTNEKLSRIVVHQGTVYLAGLTADDKSADTRSQTEQIFAKADALLASVGSDKAKLLLTQIYLRDAAEFDAMNVAWLAWMAGTVPGARVTVGASFALPEIAVEIQIIAAI
jgi:enamine deaminase RidA (YjgF/YER057c/UK114 family)